MNKERSNLLTKMSAIMFSAYELQLFLDTHPDDVEALKKKSDFERQVKAIKQEYESKHGPVEMGMLIPGTHWSWVDDPWPWDNGMEG